MRKARRHPQSDRAPESLTDDRSTNERLPSSVRQPGILDMQRQAGNSAVGRLLRRTSSSGSPAIRDRLGVGQPLPGETQARMQAAYHADLSDVRVHTGSEAARVAAEQRTQALAEGNDIAFGSGAFRPGTPVGDALIAHELAHVVQQQDSERAGQQSGGTASLEREANQSAFAALAGIWTRASSAFASTARDARPRLRSATQPLRASQCFGSEQKFDAPSYLGKYSIEALEDINRIVENTDLLGKVIVGGTVATIVTSSPEENLASGGYDVSPQAEALRAIPVIQRAKVNERIDYLILEHGNDLNEQERQFWERVRAAFTEKASSKAGGAK